MGGLREEVVVLVYRDHGQCGMAVGSGLVAVDIQQVVEEDTMLVEDDVEPCLVVEGTSHSKKATSRATSRVSKET